MLARADEIEGTNHAQPRGARSLAVALRAEVPVQPQVADEIGTVKIVGIRNSGKMAVPSHLLVDLQKLPEEVFSAIEDVVREIRAPRNAAQHLQRCVDGVRGGDVGSIPRTAIAAIGPKSTSTKLTADPAIVTIPIAGIRARVEARVRD